MAKAEKGGEGQYRSYAGRIDTDQLRFQPFGEYRWQKATDGRRDKKGGRNEDCSQRESHGAVDSSERQGIEKKCIRGS